MTPNTPIRPPDRRPVVLPARPFTPPQADYFTLAKALYRQITAIDAEIIRLQEVRSTFVQKMDKLFKGEENV